MTFTVRTYRALLALLLPSGFNDAFADDLLSVFAQLDAEARARGGRIDAWRALLRELPGLARLAVRERRTHRTVRARNASARLEENVFDSLAQDLSFAGRSLRRAPVFALVAILTLALGIGANTAIFSVVNGVLFSPLKLREPDRLVAIGEQNVQSAPNSIGVTSPGSFYDWRAGTRSMDIAAYNTVSRVLTGMGDPQQLFGTTSVGGLMQVFGVQPFLGRLIAESDEDPSAPDVIVLSYDAWRRLFSEDRTAIGKTLTLNGISRTIVGVMPAGFSFPGAPNDFWMPSKFDAAFKANRDQYQLAVIGRLHDGATIDQARAEMATVMTRLNRDWPMFNQGARSVVMPLRESIIGSVRSQLLVLMGAVGFVLLITCANIGNLLLARASGRRREIAVRQALGAGSSRIIRQLLTESIVLAVTGGLVGLAIGSAFLKLLMAAPLTTSLPRADEIALDGPVLIFTMATSLFAGLFFGVVPAWQLARGRSSELLRGSRGSGGGLWTRNALVVSELALAMILLAGAGLLLRSFQLKSRVNPGVKTENVIAFGVTTRRPAPTFFPSTVERIRSVPGVRSVALTSNLPITGRGIGAWLNRIDKPLPPGVKPSGVPYRVVTPDYFNTVGIPLKRGRLLTENDRVESPGIVVNEALVKAYYPNEDPLGKQVYMGAPDNRLFQSAPIVGVVGDTHDAGLGTDPLPTAYIPLGVIPQWPFFSYVIKTSGNAASVMTSAREIIRELDPNVAVRNVQTLEDVVSAAVAPARWSTLLLGIFAGVAVVMAVLGVFGVLSYLVTQRTRELGIRIALGASASAVQRMIVVRGLWLVGCGLAIGLAGSYALTRFLDTLLYGISATDPLTFFGVAAILASAAAVASYLPARRATRVDPIIALRTE